MPRSTYRYPFEGLVLGLAQEIAGRFAAPGAKGKFLLTLHPEGGVSSLSFAEPAVGWREQGKLLEASGVAYLFYDPFDAPEYTWVSWSGITRAAMERLRAAAFTPEDFEPLPYAGDRAAALPETGKFPATWGVMF